MEKNSELQYISYSMSKGIKVLKQNSLFDEFQINGKIDKNTLAVKLKYENTNIDKSDLQKKYIMLWLSYWILNCLTAIACVVFILTT